MVVVSDTSPLHYLILIDSAEILAKLFGSLLITEGVFQELQNANTPSKVRDWLNPLPHWISVQQPLHTLRIPHLHLGESEAISLALELSANLLIIDERIGRKAANQLQLRTTGTLGVLNLAASQKLISLSTAISALQTTSFRADPRLIAELLRSTP
ncbi:MAG: DUF3368 domain-containing protein [Pirellulales bacterium]|nr:DUF3368 domain-containing protein [Pirellulales bacterium]